MAGVGLRATAATSTASNVRAYVARIAVIAHRLGTGGRSKSVLLARAPSPPEEQDNIEHPGRCRAQSGLRTAKCARLGCTQELRRMASSSSTMQGLLSRYSC